MKNQENKNLPSQADATEQNAQPEGQTPPSEQIAGKQKKRKKEKLTRAQRKELEKRQKELEKQLIEEGKLSPRVKYVPRSFLWNLLAVCLAFFLGIVAAIGALVGGGIFAGTQMKVKDVLSAAGEEYGQYVDEAYENMSLLDLVSEVIADLQQSENLSLNTFGKYSPFVKEKVEEIASVASDAGVNLNVDELMGVPFSSIGEYFSETVLPNVELGSVLKIDAQSDAMMITLLYGKEGVDYTVTDGKIVPAEGSQNYPLTVGKLTDGLSEVLNQTELGALVIANPDEADPLMLALCYGEKGVDYTVENGKIKPAEGGKAPTSVGDLIERPSELISELQVEAILGINAESSAVMRYLAYGTEGQQYEIENGEIKMLTDPETNAPYKKRTVSTLTGDSIVEDAKISDLITLGENPSGILSAIQDWRIGDLNDQSKIMSLSVGVILNVEEGATGLMGAIRDWTLNDFTNQERIESLKIGDIITGTGSNLMQAIGEWSIGDLTNQSKIESLTIQDVLTVGDNAPAILKSLKDVPLSNFSDKISTLTMGEILGGDLESNRILRNLKDSTLKSLPDDLRALTLKDVFEEEIYSYALGFGADGRPTQTVAASDVESYLDGETEKFRRKSDGAEVTRYLSGVWYILVGESEKGENTPILELSSSVTTAAAKINSMTLGEMYAHEILSANPSASLQRLKTILGSNYPFPDEIDNLNQLTITNVITLLTAVANG